MVQCPNCGKIKEENFGKLCYTCYFFDVWEIKIDVERGSDEFYKKLMKLLIGRKRVKGEVIHHLDGNHYNNKPNNLYICKNRKEHGLFHSKKFKDYFTFDEKNPSKRCLIFYEGVWPKFRIHIAPSHDNKLKVVFDFDARVIKIKTIVDLYKKTKDIERLRKGIIRSQEEYFVTYCKNCNKKIEKDFIQCPYCDFKLK